MRNQRPSDRPEFCRQLNSTRAIKEEFDLRVLKAVAFIIVATVIGVYLYAQLDKAQTDEVATPSAPVVAVDPHRAVYKTTARALYKDYEANEVATDLKIDGAAVEVSGIVASIDKDFTDAPVIHLQTGNEYQDASLTLIDSQKHRAATLSKGQSIVIRCEKMSRIIGYPAGTDCRITP
jgi:tRNA_anti-like